MLWLLHGDITMILITLHLLRTGRLILAYDTPRHWLRKCIRTNSTKPLKFKGVYVCKVDNWVACYQG